ncbi:MAG: hypothetical protein JOZ47_01575 [Kutzneria sp.]|nr:hypothetical protein [Kutzneria sp.]
MTADSDTGTESTSRGRRPVFTGAGRLYRLIGALYQRPRVGDRPRTLTATETEVRWGESVDRAQRSGRKGLPIVCLVRPQGPDDLLGAIDTLLNEAKRGGVRHAYHDLAHDGAADDTEPLGPEATRTNVLRIRNLLRHLRNELVSNSRVRDPRLKFPLFSLAYWLMAKTADPDDPDPDRTVRELLRREGVVRRIGDAMREVGKELPGGRLRWRVPLWVVYLLTLGAFRLALTGRVPVLSGRYRWFMRQPHLAPELSGTFVRFAERLIDWHKESPEYVARLLVNSFLEDLRRAYRLRPWHLFRRRRMTYPVVLLDNITMTNGGYLFLRLVNEVRNQVGLFDPLLVVSASRDVPPDSGLRYAHRPSIDAERAVSGYVGWQNALLDSRRARQDIAWYLPIGIPDEPPEVKSEDELHAFNGFDAGRWAAHPSLLSSRLLRIGVVVAVLVGTLASSFVWHGQHCDSWHPSLHWSKSECIGVSDGSFDLFQPSDSAIRAVENVILAQNEKAEQLHKAFPNRPYVTLAHLQPITSPNGTAGGLTTQREALEGVAVAQRRQLDKSGDSSPLVRVLIVNGGKRMGQGTTVAEQLGRLQSDPPVVGAIGLDMSNQPTLGTINALSAASLPVVSAFISGDTFADDHPMHFQVAPQNRRETAVVAAFADQQAAAQSIPRTVRIYYSDDATDIYSTNLRADAETAFKAKGFQVETKAFTPNEPVAQSAHEQLGDPLVNNASAAGQDTCQYTGFVYYAGRGVPDYGDFLGGATQCLSKAVFLGDDEVGLHVADEQAREGNRALSFYYVSFAFVPPTAGSYQGLESDFYNTLNGLFPFENDPSQNRSLDGHAALSFDATNVLITAVSYLRAGGDVVPVTPAAVWREITDIHDSPTQHRFINGVTGTIDYGGDITRHVSVDKPVAILRVHDGEVDTHVVGFCGTATGHAQSSWCPPGS